MRTMKKEIQDVLKAVGAFEAIDGGEAAGRFDGFRNAMVTDELREHVRQLEDDERRTEVLNDPLVNNGFRCGYGDIIKNLPKN